MPASISCPSAGTGYESEPVDGSSRMSSTGTTTWRSSCFAVPASTSSIGAAAGDEAADLLQRALGRGERDALHGLVGEPVEPLDGEHQVGAALRRRDGVHLVEDQRADRAQHLAGLRGEDQEQRLGRGDQDVGRLAVHRGALALRRVAGADGDGELRLQAGERAAQVALDVVVQRLQRGDVEQADALARLGVEAVDPVEERGERLAGAGRRLDQRVPAGGDGRPAERLGRRRRSERAVEPGPRLRAEDGERIHAASVTTCEGLAEAVSERDTAGVRPRTWPERTGADGRARRSRGRTAE